MPKRRLDSTQGEWVKRQLLAGKALAHPDLMKACGGRGGWRLGAIVHTLRVKHGWPIESRPMPNPGPDTDLNPPVVYQLQTGWKPGSPVQQELPI
ncbi:MAG: hypothetical protein JNJ76_01260 [Candidatus Competibacter sp.]|nr:hypothetical protein [Candidatus Competibacter sp.]